MVNITDAELPVGGTTYTAANRWSDLLNPYLKDRPRWDMGRKFDVWPGLSDNGTKIQAALDAAAALSGGAILDFGRPGYYLANTSQMNADGKAAALVVAGSDIAIELHPGAVLKTELTGGHSLINVWGPAIPDGAASWASNKAVGRTATALDPAETFTMGTRRIKTETAADAGDFAPGDLVYIRTGQTIDFPSAGQGTEQPYAELNEVYDADDTTGWITLRYALSQTYQLQYFVTGTSGVTSTAVTANEAVFGVVNVSDSVVQNFSLRGGRYEVENLAAIVDMDNVLGYTLRDYTFDTGKHQHLGNTLRFGVMEDVRGLSRFETGVDATGGGAFGWLFAAGTGSCDGVLRNCRIDTPGAVPQVHFHEAVSHFVVDNVYSLGSPGRTTTTAANLSIRGGAHDILVRGGHYAYSGNTDPILHASSTCTRIAFRDVLVSGATGAGGTDGLKCEATASSVRGTRLLDGLRVLTIAGTERDTAYPYLRARDFHPTTGSPTESVVSNWPTVSFPATGTTLAGTSFRIPVDWQGSRAVVRLIMVNPGAGSGNIRMIVRVSYAANGETIAQLQSDQEFTVSSLATPTRRDWLSAAFTLPVLADINDEVLIRVGRDADDALDTLAGAWDLIAVLLEPTTS